MRHPCTPKVMPGWWACSSSWRQRREWHEPTEPCRWRWCLRVVAIRRISFGSELHATFSLEASGAIRVRCSKRGVASLLRLVEGERTGVGGVGGLRWSSDGSYISERHDWIGAVCIVYVMLPVSSSVPQERDVASGQLVFNNVCRTCHTTREGDNRLGPNLYKIVGRKAGSLQNYGNTPALRVRTSFGKEGSFIA